MLVGERSRVFVAALAAAVLLACSGVIALVFQPVGASAGVTPGVKADFTLAPGDTATESYDKLMIGSVEVKGTPDDCRNDSTVGLTCAAHRIKLHRTPGAKLTIVTEWDAQAADILSVPDVDIFLFDSPTSQVGTDAGGAGQTMPEQIDIVPTQDEYDLVVQAYAGVVNGYKVTVFYGLPASSGAGGGGGGTNDGDDVTPDYVLTPHDRPVAKQYTSPIVMTPLIISPEECRTAPQFDVACDVYRFKLNRSKAKGAVNYVLLALEWSAVTVPALQTPAIGTVEQYLPNLDIYIYDTPDHHLPTENGGTSLRLPERVGFIATQDEYDIVIQAFEGVTTGYKLTAFMTDELFDKPFELLDPITGKPIAPAVDPLTGAVDPSKIDGSTELPLPLASLDVDDQIAGIGLGTTEQFDREEAIRLGQDALRNVSIESDPPSGVILVLALIVVPAVLFAAGIVIMRRRHNVAF